MKKKFIVFVAVLFSSLGFTQNVEEVLNLINKEYSKSDFLEFETKYNLYKNKNSKKVHESYLGLFKKNIKNEIYQKIDKVETIWNNHYSLKVNHPDKLMTLSFSQPVATGEINIKELKDFCKIKSFTKIGSGWELILEPQQFSSLPYSKVVITINSSYFITKQLFYYNTIIDFSSDYRKQDLDYPVLEIINSNFNRKSIPESFFNVKKFITDKNNLIDVTKEYNTYSIDDLREITIK